MSFVAVLTEEAIEMVERKKFDSSTYCRGSEWFRWSLFWSPDLEWSRFKCEPNWAYSIPFRNAETDESFEVTYRLVTLSGEAVAPAGSATAREIKLRIKRWDEKENGLLTGVDPLPGGGYSLSFPPVTAGGATIADFLRVHYYTHRHDADSSAGSTLPAEWKRQWKIAHATRPDEPVSVYGALGRGRWTRSRGPEVHEMLRLSLHYHCRREDREFKIDRRRLTSSVFTAMADQTMTLMVSDGVLPTDTKEPEWFDTPMTMVDAVERELGMLSGDEKREQESRLRWLIRQLRRPLTPKEREMVRKCSRLTLEQPRTATDRLHRHSWEARIPVEYPPYAFRQISFHGWRVGDALMLANEYKYRQRWNRCHKFKAEVAKSGHHREHCGYNGSHYCHGHGSGYSYYDDRSKRAKKKSGWRAEIERAFDDLEYEDRDYE